MRYFTLFLSFVILIIFADVHKSWSVQINNGEQTTTSRTVTLNFTVPSGCLSVKASNEWFAPVEIGCSSPREWQLSEGDGEKTVKLDITYQYYYSYQYVCGSYCCSYNWLGQCTGTCYNYCTSGYYITNSYSESDSIILNTHPTGELINIPLTGQNYSYTTGDDGFYLNGINSPNPRFIDNNDGTITDNLTGLTWLKNANCIASKYPGFDIEGTSSDGMVGWNNAINFVNGMNSRAYPECSAGYNDWRLPNINELSSLFNYGAQDFISYLSGFGFTSIGYGYYWSSTTLSNKTDFAWYLRTDGITNVGSKLSQQGYVMPVRGYTKNPAKLSQTGQKNSFMLWDDGSLEKGVIWPNPRFSDNGDGTVKDNLTGLIWLKNASCFGARSWGEAINLSNNLSNSQCGLTDGSVSGEWRLPNINELKSLIDFSKYSPALPDGHPFINLQNYIYWTSTSFIGSPYNAAWFIHLANGIIDISSKYSTAFFIPVKGGNNYYGQPDLIIYPETYSFTNTNPNTSSNYQTFVLINNGTNNLYISKILISGNNADEFEMRNIDCMPSSGENFNTLIPGTVCSFQVRFIPKNFGTKSATVKVLSNDSEFPVSDINVSGISGRKLIVNKSGTGSGSISITGCSLTWDGNIGTCYANNGTYITLQGIPDSFSIFTGWTGGTGPASGCTGNSPCSFYLTYDSSINANFMPNNHIITTAINLANTGTIICTPNPVNHGSTATCTITPNTGYHIESISGNCGGSLSGSTYTTNPITSDCTIIANLALNQYIITASMNSAGFGSITCTPNPVDHGSTSICTITPNAGYHIETLTGTCGGTLSGNTYTTNAITSACTVIANLAINTYTLTINKTGTGSGVVTSNPSGITCGSDCNETYTHGTQITLTAVSDPDSEFESWTGDCSGNNSTTTITIDANKTCTANFKKVVTINNGIKYTTNASVTLTLDPVGTPTKMTIYNGKVWSPEENYTSQKTITIPGGDGRKDIYVRLLIDGIWKEYKDYIYFDVKAPVGSVQINGGAPVTNSSTVTLNLFVADYQDTSDIEMNISEDKTNWTGWISFQPTYNYTFTNTQEGTKTIYVQYRDKGGKTSPIYSDNIIYKTSISTVQSSNITINNGASYTNKTGVTLSITNPDTNAYTLMSFSQDLTKWTGWETYKTTRTLSLTGQDGEKWVYVRFTDNTKTATSEIYGDSIILDRKKPIGTIQINGGAYITKYPDVQLSIRATDELSGIDYIEISNDNVNWTNIGNVDTANATLTEGDGIKKIYMKIYDKAGNISATIIDTIILDTTAPVGKVTLSKNTTTSDLYDVKIAIAAPGSVWMKISIDGGNTYSDWESYKTVKILTLQEGENTISVIFKDLAGNESQPYTATITLP